MIAAHAQDQKGGIRGIVTDSVTHQPARRATVTLQCAGAMPCNPGQASATSDAGGAFSLDSVPAGDYFIMVQHRDYPQARPARKKIEVKPGEITSGVTFELVPGGAISGHILDEDGDPLTGCNVQVHQAPQLRNQVGFAQIDENGEYRVSRLTPGKYLVSANCFTLPFQPRPFSPGPDPPPSVAYTMQYYGGANDPKTAQAIEVVAGSEKPGIDFRMRPGSVTQIQGTFSPAGADWHGQRMMVQLYPADAGFPGAPAGGAAVNDEKGTFTVQRVFPGSYFLVAISNPGDGKRNGAVERIEVKDTPVEVVLTLAHRFDVSGTIQIEGNDSTNKVAPNQFNVQVTPEQAMSIGGAFARTNEDGTFTLQSLLPVKYKLNVFGPAFVKSVWHGNTNIADKVFQASAEPLRIVLSTNFGTITGTAPAGQNVWAGQDGEPGGGFRAVMADTTGNFRLPGLAPGKYRIFAGEAGVPPDQTDGKGQEVTVVEGETVSIDVKAPSTSQ